MLIYTTQIRVRYGEVDQMGFLYHANYVTYFDVARTELMRSLGISNHKLEELGYMIPVIGVVVDYGTPAHYDDLLTIRITLKEMPRVTAVFHYEVLRDDILLTTGSVKVAFMHSATKKACRPPKILMDAAEPFFR